MIFDRFFDHFSIIKNRHAGMRIQFLMSDMASANQNLISGHVTKDIQGMDQKQRIFSIKIGDFSSFFDHQKSTRRYANSIFDVRYGERKSKLDFRSRDQRYFKIGSKTTYFFDQNT